MLYSIFPPEVVFSETTSTGEATQASLQSSSIAAQQGRMVEVEHANVRLIIARDAEGGAKVVRLISSDPRDYLDPRFSPGADIRV